MVIYFLRNTKPVLFFKRFFFEVNPADDDASKACLLDGKSGRDAGESECPVIMTRIEVEIKFSVR